MTDNYDSASELGLEEQATTEQNAVTQEEGNTQEASNSGDEGKSPDLDFLDASQEGRTDDKELARQKTLEGQLKSALKKVEEGSTTLDELPEYQREWVQMKLKGSKPKKKEPVIDEETVIQRAVERLEEKQRFEKMKAEIKSLDLDNDSIKTLKQEYSDLRSAGLSEAKALEKAIRLASIDSISHEDIERQQKIQKMAIFSQGKRQSMQRKEPDPLTMNADDFLAWSNKQASGESLYIINN